jgi:hypothetical protein
MSISLEFARTPAHPPIGFGINELFSIVNTHHDFENEIRWGLRHKGLKKGNLPPSKGNKDGGFSYLTYYYEAAAAPGGPFKLITPVTRAQFK